MAAWLLSASGCAWMDNKQRLIIYRPTVGIPADFAELRVGDERYFVDVPNALDTHPHRIQLWWLPHPDANAPTLLYFHGTFRNLFQNSRKIEALRDAGFAVLAVDYRGWGLSTPITPSEQTILKDADVAWTELQRREPRASQRVIYGHSMGSGVAVDLASRLRAPQDFGGVILESAITSFTDVAREAGLLARLAASFNNERFASIEKITSVHAPLLMIHGSADKTIPMHLGEKLFAAANPPKTWLTLERGNHSNLDSVDPDSYQAALKNFRWRHIAPR
ncbi:MAG: alpha/beta fold hydrolase [Rhodoferax sp.]|nr:alpha/beta fold hydrolase [Rhodoferax sp.]